ncbi:MULTISPECIES: YciI family protein [unclassified Streptosporangium]|uniref:YciI family protein n=1 Tax=unclassified Streptosporangium TaxID=2632669 RepID=UPI002E2DF1B4|nr:MULTISPECIES: YciI family protein [unclassified Streptosporangium]
MKFLLNLYLNAADPPGEGFDHEDFLAAAGQTGELISAHAFADPSISAVIRDRGGVVTVTEGPYLQTPDHVAGQYVVDCESRERAVELATLIPGGQVGGVEVRPLMDSAGMEM